MALARNLKPKKFNFKIPNIKYKKQVVIGAICIAVIISILGLIALTRIIPSGGNKQEVKYQTGDRPLPQTITLWVTADGGLNMRENADKNAKTILLIPTGTQLTAEETKDDWYKVSYMNKTGWVNKNYVTTTAPVEDPTKSWNTFTNKNYNYSLRYPKDWVAQDYGANPATSSQSYVGFGRQLPATLDPNQLPQIIVRASNQAIDQASATYRTASNSVAEAASISGLPGTKYTFNSSSGTQMTAYVVAKGPIIYIIEETGGYADELSKLIASFNLT